MISCPSNNPGSFMLSCQVQNSILVPHQWINFGQLAVFIPFPKDNLIQTVSMSWHKLVTYWRELHVTNLRTCIYFGHFLERIQRKYSNFFVGCSTSWSYRLMLGIETYGLYSCIVLVPACHSIHSLKRKQQKSIIVSSCCDHVIILRNSKSTDFLLMGLISENLRTHTIVLNCYIPIFTSSNNQVVRATYWPDSSAMQMLHDIVGLCMNIKYLHMAFIRSDTNFWVMSHESYWTYFFVGNWWFVHFLDFARASWPNIETRM